MTVSIMSSGAASVGVSARPALPTTCQTSGNPRKTSSRTRRSRSASAIEARGTVVGMSIRLCSSRSGMNSRPSFVEAT